MGIVLDALYAGFAVASAPWWLRKRRSGLRERFGAIPPLAPTTRPRLLLHAVSVGEVGLVRQLVEELRRDCDVVVSAMTDTGLARARQLYEGRAAVTRFPYDASFAVRRFLDAVQPDAVGLVELEVWPNFVAACASRGIPVGVVNGRLSGRSFRRYRLAQPLLRSTFAKLAFVAAQNETYAQRFAALGAAQRRVSVAGSMKWDAALAGAEEPDLADRAKALGARLGVDPARPLVVAGSTAPEEHALLRAALPEGAQLLCAPRRPEWFDEAARVLAPCARHSRTRDGAPAPPGGHRFFLLDAIGLLRQAYALADVVVLGRSFGSLHGSDPMEPAALGKPLLIGPRVEDFTDAVEALKQAGALAQTSRGALRQDLGDMLADSARRARMGRAARACVEAHAGATDRCAQLLRSVLAQHEGAQR